MNEFEKNLRIQEPGIGVEKTNFIAKQFAPANLDAMQMLRHVFGPEQRGNPHKMFPGGKRGGDFQMKKQAAV